MRDTLGLEAIYKHPGAPAAAAVSFNLLNYCHSN